MMAKSKWAYIGFFINVVLNINKVFNILQDSILLIKRKPSDIVYESDSEEGSSKPKRLDKGKGKATEEDEKRWAEEEKKKLSESLDKGTEEDENKNKSSWWPKPWGTAIPENKDPNASSSSSNWFKRPFEKAEDKPIVDIKNLKEYSDKDNSGSNIDSDKDNLGLNIDTDKDNSGSDVDTDKNNSGSDIDTDEELNEDIRDEMDFLVNQESKTQADLDRIETLSQLLNNQIQKKVSKPPVPDFWNHWSKPPVDEKASKEPQLTTNPTQATSNQNVEASASNTNTDFDNKPRETEKNVSESTPPTVTQSTPGTVTQSSDSSEKPKQTPTEYVHELESTEPASFGWDDGD